MMRSVGMGAPTNPNRIGNLNRHPGSVFRKRDVDGPRSPGISDGKVLPLAGVNGHQSNSSRTNLVGSEVSSVRLQREARGCWLTALVVEHCE